MQNGLYKVSFVTPLGHGDGVVFLDDGKVRGGDSAMFYNGTYQIDGQKFAADIVIDRHSSNPEMESVLGKDRATLKLEGTFTGTSAEVHGSSPQAPDIDLSAKLTRLAD